MKVFSALKWFFSFFTSLLFLTALPVSAQETVTVDGLDHQFSLGAIGIVMPKFEGGPSQKVRGFPLVDYRNQYFFVSMLKGAGFHIIDTPTLTMGPLIAYRFERKEHDSPLLKGLGNVKGGAEAGFLVHWQFHEQFSAEIKGLQGIGNAKGFKADASLTYQQPLTSNLLFALQTSAQFANADYNQQYFGINASQSERSGYERYSPGSGIKHVSIKPAVHYRLSDQYSVSLFYEYKRLTGPAADSPLVKKGSANQSTTAVAFTWHY